MLGTKQLAAGVCLVLDRHKEMSFPAGISNKKCDALKFCEIHKKRCQRNQPQAKEARAVGRAKRSTKA